MKFIATSFGSAGDFLPTLSVGAALRAAGHQVLFVSNPFYESLALSAGLDFLPAGKRINVFTELERNPLYMDSIKGPDAIWTDFAVPHISDSFRVIRDRLASEHFDGVVSSNVSAGGVWAAAEHQCLNTIVAASPLSWIHGGAPMIFTDRAPPSFMLPMLNQSLRKAITWYLDRRLRQLARELGARMADPSLAGAERAAHLHVGLWSPLIRPPAQGDPPNTLVCGFARAGHLGQAHQNPNAELEAFLDAGTPPVVVGLGSAISLNAGSLLHDLALVCQDLGERCVILGHPSHAPSFPPNTFAVKYAPYDQIFPRASVVVIHGGAGTTMEGLRAGKPILALPFAYDQFAMAWQVDKLGVGRKLSLGDRNHKILKETLFKLLKSEEIRKKALGLGARLRTERDGAEVATERIVMGRPRG